MSKSKVCVIKHKDKINSTRIKEDAKLFQGNDADLTTEQAMTLSAKNVIDELRNSRSSLQDSPDGSGKSILINGKLKSSVNSNGDRLASTDDGIRKFWQWFGDSKVVDDHGRPLVLTHGTQAEFDSFDPKKIGRIDAGYYGWGFYFTQDKNLAGVYGQNKMPVYLSLQNPLIIKTTDRGHAFDELSEYVTNKSYPRKVTKELLESGYDGVLVKRGATSFHGNAGDVLEAVVIEDSWDTGRSTYDPDTNKVTTVPGNPLQPNANTKIKIADGSNTEFGTGTGNLKFSMADSIPSAAEMNAAIRDYFQPNKGKQALGWLAGVFQRNHLIDFAAKELPMLETYKELNQAKDNAINKFEHEIATSYQSMKDKMSSKEMAELGRVQGAATRLKDFDPDQYTGSMTDLDADEQEVFQDYLALSDNAQSVYRQMRDDYRDDLRAKKRALIERLNDFPVDIETRAKIIREIEQNFDQHIMRGVYFPLSRHGNIVVTANKYDTTGTVIEDERVVSFVETAKDKDRLVEEMVAQGYARENIKTTLKDVYIKSLAESNAATKIAALATQAIANIETSLAQENAEEILSFAGFNASEIIRGGNYNDILNDFNQLVIEALPDTSYRKHFLHRKGTKGSSTDALRSYASTRSSAAKAIAGLKFNHKITEKLNDANKALKDMAETNDTIALKSVVNELQLREETLKSSSSSPAAQALTSIGFIGALGFNIASAAVNLMQVPGVTLPELSGQYGVKKAASAIKNAYKLVFSRKVLEAQAGFNLLNHPDMSRPENEAMKRALQELNDIGKIDLTMTHDAISMGKNPSYSDHAITRIAGKVGKYSGYLFHVAEALNRQVTGISAFKLAYEQNGGNYNDALKKAIDTIDRTQFDYSQGNRSRYMMSDTARVVTLFKAYALGISYYVGRNLHNAIKGDTPAERLIARKTLVTQMAMTFATSGLFGLPIGMEAFGMIGGVAGFKYKGANFSVPGAIGGMVLFQFLLWSMGEDDDDEMETDFRNWLTDNFDQTTAEWITKGPARLLPIGDIAGRTGLNDVWWRSQNKELEGRDQFQAVASTLLGPVGSQAAGFFTAAKLYKDGEYSRMVESLSPAAVRNIVATKRLATEGARTIKGDPILDRDMETSELINKLFGFNPTSLANNYEANSAIVRARDKINMKKSHLVNRYIAADPHERQELMKGDIKDFNDSVEPQERITIPKLVKSMRQRQSMNQKTEGGLYLSKRQQYLRSIGRFAEDE